MDPLIRAASLRGFASAAPQIGLRAVPFVVAQGRRTQRKMRASLDRTTLTSR